ncbi:acetyl-CoA carboxylase biotin carboxylase subunit [Planomonospora venezuelensis]|uniref:biotin carboxylase n=1 Tax=Planomonospora venezuelensis TaxID=1999 RepID=A0A841D2M6_PLAVE|nr:acetyl-CoA carboxylase biotin carboxylase subunit [Planomonospora venezuelensis]MBB5962425.1 acetyl-CoA carboxylase biotin carboxylase subunit [Planomonospora venezuelensis]GIN00807.1 acetyl-CoA carboxylase biotin carboxylase subunit [Planomonospora venezuelensis]
MKPLFDKVLIANRGEIALRVARTCREMGIRTVAVHSTADRDARFVSYADESVHIGPGPAKRSYLYVPNVIEAALRTGAEAIHPGYGFLSEDADFAQVCAENGITFIGPRPEVMECVGDKARVRSLMAAAGLPVLPGSEGTVPTLGDAEAIAGEIGYPVIVKAAAGGGGRGIEVAGDRAELQEVYRRTTALARQVFGNGDVYIERYLPAARHVEIQLLCDELGNAVHLGERDCSLQRRNQKLIEEAPSPALPQRLRALLGEYAVAGARSVGYTGAGTMEFLVDPAGNVTFMEINGRIQVEHPVTEMLTGIDLVREQIRVAAGHPLPFTQQEVRFTGAAVECRVNAEDPRAGFRPTPGRLEVFRVPGGPGTRVDSGFAQGDTVPPNYDSLVAKVIVWAPSREEAIARAQRALAEFEVGGPGVATTIPLLRQLLAHPSFERAEHTTRFVDELMAEQPTTRWAA